MSSETQMLSSKVHDTVFTKTARGRAEVTERSAGLNGKQRSVLIMLDGRKSMRDIASLLPEDEIARIVEMLLERELIAPWAEAVVSSAASENHKDAAKLLRTKTLMTDSAMTYLGLMASEVVRRVQDASDEIELISVVGHWHMAMRESKHGRQVAAIHLEQVKTSLRGEA